MTVYVTAPIHAVFDRAAQIIRDYGWIQCRSGDYRIGFCAAGAVNQALLEMAGVEIVEGVRQNSPPMLEVMQVITNRMRGYQTPGAVSRVSLPSWNDHPGRTVDEVLALLDELSAPPDDRYSDVGTELDFDAVLEAGEFRFDPGMAVHGGMG